MFPYTSQIGSLEWKSYADLVAQQLEKNGLVQIDKPREADYGVFINYAVDGGQTYTYSTPIIGQTGSVTSSGGRVTPVYGVVGTNTNQGTLYGRTVKVTIYDVRRERQEKKPVVAFEGIGSSAGPGASLHSVMPTIVTGIFTDFPGPSGETRRVYNGGIGPPQVEADRLKAKSEVFRPGLYAAAAGRARPLAIHGRDR
jgi:hypothetical protein